MDLKHYKTSSDTFDELLTGQTRARPGMAQLVNFLKKSSLKELNERKRNAELAITTLGISFTVYTEGDNIDREWPFDIIPRVIRQREWQRIELGLTQRLRALNCFIDDIYNDGKILKDKRIPRDLLNSSTNFRKECQGMSPVFGTWAHICGSDLIRDNDGTMYVLEDNLRVPSGVSYMLENRNISKRILPELFEDYEIRPMDDYPAQLFDTLSSISPRPMDFPEVVVLTPGIYNSAYFEHSFLAQRMGAELVEGQDLVVGDDDCVYMK
ncbi:MAG: circularly permuted type 2 ATP-grasp protein, partial [Pseudomonadales bacterium]